VAMTAPQPAPSRWREHRVAALWTIVGGLIFMGSVPLWVTWAREHVLPTGLGGTANVATLKGGCAEGWQVYAQNQWTPVGTAVREEPNVDSKKLEAISPNIPFMVDGWVHASVAYEYNPAPFNSDIWLHRKRGGWVSFAGVRSVPTEFDPKSRSEGVFPAPLPDDCEGEVG